MLASVVVISSNNVIGCDGDLVFDIKEDLKRFREITSSSSAIMVMGRKTFESLPGILPDRQHIILTNNENYTIEKANDRVEILTDINEVIERYADTDEEVFVIGGGVIFEELMPHTKKHYITYVNKDAKGDTFFPKFNEEDFDVVFKSEEYYADVEDCTYYYVDYLQK